MLYKHFTEKLLGLINFQKSFVPIVASKAVTMSIATRTDIKLQHNIAKT